jgi:hypothetical protein
MDNDDDAKKRRRKREFGDQDMIDAQFRGYDEEEKEQTTENYTKRSISMRRPIKQHLDALCNYNLHLRPKNIKTTGSMRQPLLPIFDSRRWQLD